MYLHIYIPYNAFIAHVVAIFFYIIFFYFFFLATSTAYFLCVCDFYKMHSSIFYDYFVVASFPFFFRIISLYLSHLLPRCPSFHLHILHIFMYISLSYSDFGIVQTNPLFHVTSWPSSALLICHTIHLALLHRCVHSKVTTYLMQMLDTFIFFQLNTHSESVWSIILSLFFIHLHNSISLRIYATNK